MLIRGIASVGLLVFTAAAAVAERIDPVDEVNVIFLYDFDGPQPLSDAIGVMPRLVLGAPASISEEGIEGKALEIHPPRSRDHDGNYAQLSPSAAARFPGYAFSLDFYFRPDEAWLAGDSNTIYLLDQMYTDATGIRLTYSPDSRSPRVTVGNGEKRLSAASEAREWPVNQWVHIAVTYDAETGALRLFEDGLLLAEEVNPDFGAVEFGRRPFRIGNRLGSFYGNAVGTFDNIRMSHGAVDFSAAE